MQCFYSFSPTLHCMTVAEHTTHADLSKNTGAANLSGTKAQTLLLLGVFA